MDELMTIREFCAQQRVSRQTLYNWLAKGEGPETIYVGRKRMVSAEAVEAWRRWRTCALSRDEVRKITAGLVWEALPQLMDEHGSVPGLAAFAQQLGVIAEALGAGTGDATP